MEAAKSSEMLVYCHNPEDHDSNFQRRESLVFRSSRMNCFESRDETVSRFGMQCHWMEWVFDDYLTTLTMYLRLMGNTIMDEEEAELIPIKDISCHSLGLSKAIGQNIPSRDPCFIQDKSLFESADITFPE